MTSRIRHPLLFLPLAIAGCAAGDSPIPVSDGTATAAYVNGRWWDGERFEARTMYVIADSFSVRVPARIDREIDLAGAWVVPPFAETHNHNFETASGMASLNERLLREGVFYGMSLTNWAHRKPEVLPFWGRVETVDVAFADLGLTASRGHPILIYENLARGRFDFDPTHIALFRERQAEGRAYLLFDEIEDVDAKWPDVVASAPDLLKIFLLESERWDELARDTTRLGDRGLRPDIAARIVERAHAHGLRVAAHVETAHDFRITVDMGVDIVAHLPGYGLRYDAGRDTMRYRVDETDARDAEARGVIVIPTPLAPVGDGEVPAHVRAFQAGQLRRLRDAGVRLAIGSDNFLATPWPEVRHLHGLEVFTNSELLEMWGRTSAVTIFPDRRIGQLRPGFEASFLVLECDPLDAIECFQRIRLRVKQGREVGD
jgi:imidazolonepropionase-like amidohydrolase